MESIDNERRGSPFGKTSLSVLKILRTAAGWIPGWVQGSFDTHPHVAYPACSGRGIAEDPSTKGKS